MSTHSRDDILLADAPETAPRPLRVRLAAYVPITFAVLGVAAILLGGLPAQQSTATADNQAADPILTGSIR